MIVVYDMEYELTNTQFNQYLLGFNKHLLETTVLDLLDLYSGDKQLRSLLSFTNSTVKIIAQEKKYVLNQFKVRHPDSLNRLLLVTFTISYDDFFTCPVLYFRIFEEVEIENETKSRALLTIEDMDESFQHILGINSETHSFTKISFDGHHMSPTSDIWMYLHPCDTKDVMRSFKMFHRNTSEEQQVLDYFTLWYNTFGIGALFPRLCLRIKPTALS